MAGLENILMGVSYLHPFFSAKFSAGAICLILRSGGSGVGGDSEAIRRKGFWVPTPHITSQPTVHLFLRLHSARCN